MGKSKAMAGTRWPVENSLRLIILSVMLLIAPIRADPETRLLAFGCSDVPNTNVALFAKNLKAALAAVVENVVPSGFATKNEAGASDLVDSVYALAQCRKDKSSTDCANCIKVARKKIGNCTKVTGGKASYDGCFLRYENYNFYNTGYTDPGNMEVCGTANASNSNSFSATAQSLISDLCTATPRINGYFAAQTRQGPSNTTVYGLASCIHSLQRDSCEKCLAIAQDNINKCFSRSEGRAVDAGCYLRYDSKPFFPSNATIDLADFLPRGKKASSTVWIIIGVVGGVFLGGLITCLLLFRKQIIRPSQKEADTEGATELRGPVAFDFKILKKATNNFDQANKLGQGGFGEVFKGTLKNGNVVAIKKLTLGRSVRATAEFESEVKLISNVHHKNLVRLLGCCRQGHERLLVYEYMPNGSLDRILFGEHKKHLGWKERFNIILGTARGLAYLHEEFHICIIHRDIKSSNILVDHNLEAKIADFGLARLLPHDKSHISTKFAGTLGYTAPEYAGHGQLTEKADTYSFGVVVLEIVSGRKSIDLNQPPDKQYLLEWVWSLHEENKVLEMAESKEKIEGYSEEEVLRVINLALQCIQGSTTHRPSMSEVVTILLSKAEIDFQKPLQPAFVDVGYKVRGESSPPSSQSNATVTESLSAR
ncbi:cysteine-rich receptor-like protein kinase 42 [Cryptomeria japonica]|uniref:cysteine-rich receptor-like protein kinase 42 n=1 Tax=Cryptomeria japonica TaxID=3369 RepID=UPI0025AD3D78|nr:cysteine-rich receptor-like protein kinase 42 [Cryptomeria japonica]